MRPLAAALFSVLLASSAWARVSPLTSISQQIQKPNMLLLLDTSASMMNVPGEPDLDFYEAGQDCDSGDKYCRMVGKPGRCYFTAAGKFGAGIENDTIACSTDAECNNVAFCKEGKPVGCDGDAMCGDDGGACKGKCSHNGTTSCNKDSDCGAPGRRCQGVCSGTPGVRCESNPAACGAGGICSKHVGTNNFCVLSGATHKIQMCRVTQRMCRVDADCSGAAGDTCGPASSRMTIAKRVVNSVVGKFHSDVNFGLMHFSHKNYFPYLRTSSSTTMETRKVFVPKDQLETAGCWTEASGPATTCTMSTIVHTLATGAGTSRYRYNRGFNFDRSDDEWDNSICKSECQDAIKGTGIYEGSYYNISVPVASTTTTVSTQTTYSGKTKTISGNSYIYWEADPTRRNVDNIHGKPSTEYIAGTSSTGGSCGGGAQWDVNKVPFMDTSATLPAANATAMAAKIAAITQKASLGGLAAAGGTPSACALKNDGPAATREWSAYHYVKYVKDQNAANGVACRPNYVLFITDGRPGGDWDDGCASAACSAVPALPTCSCKSMDSAKAIFTELGARVYVVGFSASVANGEEAAIMNNIAKAGGTTSAYLAVNEDDLYTKVTAAIYDAIKGSYSTSPVSSASSADSKAFVLDSRVDFPAWKGHLIAYDMSKPAAEQLQWDALSQFENPINWKTRNVWTSSGTAMLKILVAADGTISNAAELAGLGLGANATESSLAARWLLGDPAMTNKAVLGAFVGSTPTEVDGVIYVGASDGMLHAFRKTDGKELFAYIPQGGLKTITRLFAQGGQVADPREHIYGIASSPKAKKVCTDNCASPSPVYQTTLVVPQGFGGAELFTLDVTDSAAPKLMWHTEHAISLSSKSAYDSALGLTISLPGFFFGKSSTMDDHRLLFASGYTSTSNSTTKGLTIVSASAKTGEVKQTASVYGQGVACTKPKVEVTEPTVLADIAIARRYKTADSDRIAAAYLGDTWGNLFRYVPDADASGNITAAAGSLGVVDSFSCSKPIHFAPAVVQFDRDDAAKRPGEIYVVQVTNSHLDAVTIGETAGFPGSEMVIRKELATGSNAITADLTWGDASGRMVLRTSSSTEICAVWNAAAKTCTTSMPTRARPAATPTAILRDDSNGFLTMSLWYVPDVGGCGKGSTYLAVHSIDVGAKTAKQLFGEKVGSEPVVGTVYAAGSLVVVLESGPKKILPLGAQFSDVSPAPAVTSGLQDRYRRMSWVELP